MTSLHQEQHQQDVSRPPRRGRSTHSLHPRKAARTQERSCCWSQSPFFGWSAVCAVEEEGSEKCSGAPSGTL